MKTLLAGATIACRLTASDAASMRFQFQIKHLLWLVIIAAGVLAIVRKDPQLLLVFYTLAVSYAAFLVTGKAMELLDDFCGIGWTGGPRKRKIGDRAREVWSLILGLAIGGCFWLVAMGFAAWLYQLFRD